MDALGAPHVGERSEKELIASFVDKIAALSLQLVTFNGSSLSGVAAPRAISRAVVRHRISGERD